MLYFFKRTIEFKYIHYLNKIHQQVCLWLVFYAVKAVYLPMNERNIIYIV